MFTNFTCVNCNKGTIEIYIAESNCIVPIDFKCSECGIKLKDMDTKLKQEVFMKTVTKYDERLQQIVDYIEAHSDCKVNLDCELDDIVYIDVFSGKIETNQSFTLFPKTHVMLLCDYYNNDLLYKGNDPELVAKTILANYYYPYIEYNPVLIDGEIVYQLEDDQGLIEDMNLNIPTRIYLNE